MATYYIFNDSSDADYSSRLRTIDGLDELVEKYINIWRSWKLFMMGLLHSGLSEFSMISKKATAKVFNSKDLTDSLFDWITKFEDEEWYLVILIECMNDCFSMFYQ